MGFDFTNENLDNEIMQYYKLIKEYAQIILDDRNVSDKDTFDNLINVNDLAHDEANQSEYILYNHYHIDIIKLSSNRNAYEELGEELSGDLSTVLQVVAFWAFREDLIDALNEIYKDLPDTEAEEEEDNE